MTDTRAAAVAESNEAPPLPQDMIDELVCWLARADPLQPFRAARTGRAFAAALNSPRVQWHIAASMRDWAAFYLDHLSDDPRFLFVKTELQDLQQFVDRDAGQSRAMLSAVAQKIHQLGVLMGAAAGRPPTEAEFKDCFRVGGDGGLGHSVNLAGATPARVAAAAAIVGPVCLLLREIALPGGLPPSLADTKLVYLSMVRTRTRVIFPEWDEARALAAASRARPHGGGGLTFFEQPPGRFSGSGISVLNLSNNALGRLPAALLEMPGLKRVIVDFNKIREIPVWVAQLRSLQRLSLAGNKIKFVPGYVFEMPTLLELELRENRICELGDFDASKTKLYIINLSRNRLERLPAVPASCLQCYANNRIRGPGARPVVAISRPSANLLRLNMEGNKKWLRWLAGAPDAQVELLLAHVTELVVGAWPLAPRINSTKSDLAPRAALMRRMSSMSYRYDADRGVFHFTF